jgi:RNase H-fold protein (predicted Holliday junction resolvase)
LTSKPINARKHHLGTRLALDPGSRKCGWAIECPLSHSPLVGVVNLDRLGTFLRWVSRFFDVSRVVVGGGTAHQRVITAVGDVFGTDPIAVIDEHGSTREALKLYLQASGGGWMAKHIRYLFCLLTNPPLDGYAAWVLLGRDSRS